MTTTWNARSPVSTSWGLTRMGGAFLTDVNGVFITDVLGRRIRVKVLGLEIPFEDWGKRSTVTTTWIARTPI